MARVMQIRGRWIEVELIPENERQYSVICHLRVHRRNRQIIVRKHLPHSDAVHVREDLAAKEQARQIDRWGFASSWRGRVFSLQLEGTAPGHNGPFRAVR